MGNIVRGMIDKGPSGDANKATNILFHKLADDPDTPLRVAVGPEAHYFVKQQLKKVEADVKKYESWSENLH